MKDIVIVVLGVALIALFVTKKDVIENFWGLPGRTVRMDKEYKVENKYQSDMFSVPPTYQSMISPRFSNVGYSAQIRYNIPPQRFLASPEYPLTFQGDVKEMYPGEMKAIKQFAQNAQNGEFEVGSGDADSLSQDEVNAMNAGSKVGPQIINYDRLIFANQRSRLYGRGDPIRGDLPIQPVISDWFRPSVVPNIDLRQGAMNIMGGSDNSTANELRALQAQFSGKATLAQKNISLDGDQADIVVTAFP